MSHKQAVLTVSHIMILTLVGIYTKIKFDLNIPVWEKVGNCLHVKIYSLWQTILADCSVRVSKALSWKVMRKYTYSGEIT